MAEKPPKDPNKSIDLRAAAASAACADDLQTDGGVHTRPIRAAAGALMLPPNVQRGLPPPVLPGNFNRLPGFSPHINGHRANIFNISHSSNVQIGHTNVMNFAIAGTNMSYFDASDDSEAEEAEQLAIEEAKIQELRKCEREITNIELQDIAQHIGLGWRRLVRFLGIQDYDVDEIYEEYGNHGLEEVIYQLLKRWKNEETNATVAEVLYQLERCDMGHLARHLRDEDFNYTD